MLTYLRGYNWVDDKAGGCDKCCEIPVDPVQYSSRNTLVWSDWTRYASWFMLFKELDFVTKDDTVYTYLCNKCNSDLDPFFYRWNGNEPLYKVKSQLSCYETPDGVKLMPTIDKPVGDFWDSDLVDHPFPKELIKMADNYRVGRTVEFVERIVNVACYSEIGQIVSVGARLPKAVINAVSGFNPVVSSLNSIVENCKTLYAAAIPEVTGITYNKYSSSTDSILKYDPSRNDAFYSQDNDDYVIGKSFVKCHYYITELLRERLFDEMRNAVIARDVPLCNQIREAIVSVIGVLVYINSLASVRESCFKFAFVNSGESYNINMLKFKDGIDRERMFGKCDFSTDMFKIVCDLMGLTPDAALCVGNMFGTATYGYEDRITRLSEYLAVRRSKPSVIVGQFLKNEAEFQYGQRRTAIERIKRFREGVK